MPYLAHILCFLYLCKKLSKIYTGVYNTYEVLNWQHQIFHICKPYLSIPMIPLVFHVWQSYLFLADAYEVFNLIHKYFTFGNHSCSFTYMTTLDSFFGTHISFYLFMPISYEILHTCVYIQNTNVHIVLSWQHQIFYICNHICSFTFMIPLVFHIWQSDFLFLSNS